MNLGHPPQRSAVLVLYALGAVSGLLALAISHLPAFAAYSVAIVAGIAALAAIALLELAPYERQSAKKESGLVRIDPMRWGGP